MTTAAIIEQRDAAWQKLAITTTSLAFAFGLAIGVLAGWNLHETSDVRANYIAGLPTCQEAGND